MSQDREYAIWHAAFGGSRYWVIGSVSDLGVDSMGNIAANKYALTAFFIHVQQKPIHGPNM